MLKAIQLQLIAALFDSHNSTRCAAMWFRHIPEADLSREYTPSASPFEMLLLGFKAVWRTEQNSTVAGTEHSCVWWSQGLWLYITQQCWVKCLYQHTNDDNANNVNQVQFQPAGGAKGKYRGSSKLLGFSLWAPNTIKFHGNTFSSFWDISVRTKVVDRLTDIAVAFLMAAWLKNMQYNEEIMVSF